MTLFIYFLLYNIVLVLPYIDLNPPWVYMCSPSWNPIPTPSPSHPSGSSQCTSPEHPVSCIEPGHNCCFLTCKQVSQEAGQVVWDSHLFQNFPQFIVIHTVKDFVIVNKAEIDFFFLEYSCIFDDPADVGNLISGFSDFSKISLNIWKFTVLVLLKPGSENFEYYFTSIRDVCNYVVVWAFFGIAFLRDWNENGPFPVLWPLLSFPNLPAYWVQHFRSIVMYFKALLLGSHTFRMVILWWWIDPLTLWNILHRLFMSWSLHCLIWK